MQVTMTMEEYTKLITANAKQVEQLNKMMEKYEKIGINVDVDCDFCNKKKAWFWGARTGVSIEDSRLKIRLKSYDLKYDKMPIGDYKINYCPMCGKKLGD